MERHFLKCLIVGILAIGLSACSEKFAPGDETEASGGSSHNGGNTGESNQAPTLSSLSDQNISENSNTGSLDLIINDVDTELNCLTSLSGVSSNLTLVPISNIVFGGTAPNCTVTITPLSGQVGTTTITLEVSDGSLTAQGTLSLVVNAVVPACVPANCATGKCLNGDCIISLGTGNHAVSGRDYELLGLPRKNGGMAYAQWFPPASASNNSTVIFSNPYDGIGWTNETIDNWWLQYQGAAGCYQDVSEPSYVQGTSAQICYQGMLSEDDTAIQAYGFLTNDVGVLMVFGRFYTGVSLDKPVEDITTGVEFLAYENSNYDPNQTAVFGMSLGGFEAFYGTANAEESLRPKVGAGVAPLLDLDQLYTYVNQTVPAELAGNSSQLKNFEDFFDPYMRRTSFTSSNLSKYSIAELSSKLNGDFLVIHDSWDVLVPIQSSLDLVAAGTAEGIWYNHDHTTPINYHTSTLTHSQSFPNVPASEDMGFSAPATFSYSYILSKIIPSNAPFIVIYDYPLFSTFLGHIHSRKVAGDDVSWLVPHLIEMAHSRVQMVDPSNAAYNAPGYHVIGLMLNTHWGAGLTQANFSTNVIPYLQTNGL